MKKTSCLCYRKGNEFLANHNMREYGAVKNEVVFVTTKVMNFEQITTLSSHIRSRIALSLLPQR